MVSPGNWLQAPDEADVAPGDLVAASAGPPRLGDLFDPSCPTRHLLDRLGGKWTSMAIKVLDDGRPGEIRFAELKRRMPGISQKMLAQTLRMLERDSLVARRVEETSPPRVHYQLTDLGVSLTGPLAALRVWAEHHMAQIDDAGAAWDRASRAG
jgi:DNA-binding HxlR family transcriptional regulator